jgi:hypothetical protein
MAQKKPKYLRKVRLPPNEHIRRAIAALERGYYSMDVAQKQLACHEAQREIRQALQGLKT